MVGLGWIGLVSLFSVAPSAFERPVDWPPAIVFPTSFDADSATVTVGYHGDLRLEHTVAGTASDVASPWENALAAAGYTRRDPCPDAPDHPCVWAGHDRLVTITTVAAADGNSIDTTVHWLPVGHVAKVRLPGACVALPVRQRVVTVHISGIDQRGQFRQATMDWDITGHAGPDLDGDGLPEMLVPHDSAGTCPWEIPHDVYVMRGACGHKIGTIVGQLDEATHTSPFRKGLRRILTHASWSEHGATSPIPEQHTRERTYGFDGKRLKKTSDEARSGRCHHCGVEQCTEP